MQPSVVIAGEGRKTCRENRGGDDAIHRLDEVAGGGDALEGGDEEGVVEGRDRQEREDGARDGEGSLPGV